MANPGVIIFDCKLGLAHDMNNLEKRILVFISSHGVAPGPLRDVIAGIGQAFDPQPREYRGKLYEPNDVAALTADLEALYLDWIAAEDRIHTDLRALLKGSHHSHEGPVRPTRAAEQRAEREQQPA